MADVETTVLVEQDSAGRRRLCLQLVVAVMAPSYLLPPAVRYEMKQYFCLSEYRSLAAAALMMSFLDTASEDEQKE